MPYPEVEMFCRDPGAAPIKMGGIWPPALAAVHKVRAQSEPGPTLLEASQGGHQTLPESTAGKIDRSYLQSQTRWTRKMRKPSGDPQL
jgi:hypothetical protein